ncbi:activating signal cointegrator 1 complex subunit 1-like isoform X2 [Triticum dicoccoides]|uniref:activating signal cointegrator 1 complex subunit 1-like isoform X2 n=1 Tax=Triticum dicoccoides TaxID=85692 RepID=UPI00188FFC3E|nr:activating signal cointegrator 1 complex subunit 1-like isoform X2 [Triticum dicoccoides]
MFAHGSLARFSRLARTRRPPLVAASPLRYLQGSVGPNNLPSVMERSQGASNNAAKHRKTNPPVQTWRPVSTQASPREAHLDEISNSGRKQMAGTSITDSENLVLDETTNVGIEVTTNNTFSSESSSTFSSSATKVAAENTMEVIREKYSSSVEVDVPLMRFLKGKGGSVQKQIEQETGVKIIFPSGKEETLVALEGKSAESIGKASERIAKILEEAVQSPMLDYSHFISLPLAIHPDLVEKLNNFQRSILGVSASNIDSDKDEILSEGSVDEIDEAASPSVPVKQPIQEEKPVIVKMDNKGSQPEFGIDKSIFIKPKTFHLTVLMLKLWNKDRIAQASDILQSVSSQVNAALENRPISIQLRGLTCMKGSPARARVVYAPVLEVGGEGRLVRACKVITEAFVKSGLVLERDARQELRLHATIMNVRHRKSKKSNRRNDSFDARNIFRQYGEQDWGEYPVPAVHLSQRFKFDKGGYYHCCCSIPLPEVAQTE